MKIIKTSILLLLVLVQCYFCGQINNEMTMQYYDQGFKKSAFLSLPAHLDTIEENKALYRYIIGNQDKGVTFVNTTMKQSKSNVFLKSNDDAFMKSIFSSSDAEKLDKGKSVIKHTGDRFENQTYEFKQITPTVKRLDGMLVIYSKNEDVLTTIKNQLKAQFNLDGDMQSAPNQSHTEDATLPYNVRIALSYLAVINSILLVVILLFYSFQQRKINIYRLHGKTVHEIILDACSKDVIVYATLAGVIGCCYTLMLYHDGGLTNYITWMVIISVIQIVFFLLYYTLLFVLLKTSHVLNGIRNKLQTRSLLLVNSTVKFIIILLTSIICTNLISSMFLVLGEYETSKHLSEVTKNSVQFDSMRSDYNFSREELTTIFYNTQAALEKSDTIYIEPTVYEYDYKKPSIEELGYDLLLVFDDTVRVNKTFLKEHKIVDVNGKAITFSNEDQTMHPFFAIPESKWNEKQQQALKQNPKFQGMEFTFVKIKDEQEVFAFSAKAGVSTNGFIKDAIFLVDGGYDTNHYIINLDNMKGNTKAKRYQNWLHNNNIPDIYFYKNPSDFVNIVVNDLEGKLLQSIIQFIFLLASILLLSYQFIYTYICSNRKRILIYKTHGASLFDRYATTLMIYLSIYIIAICSLLFLSQQTSMLPLLLIFALDSIVVLYFILRLEKRAIVLELKGGE